MLRERFIGFERASIDMNTGEFAMTLATSGEASDGHVMSIAGGRVPSKIPLLISHENDPRSQIGSIHTARKTLDTSPEKLTAIGQIELGGEGGPAEIRRDLAYMISQGHVRGVSIRWEPLKWQARTQLPKEHPAFVEETEPNYAKRYGLYFSQWRALEGSVVSVGADPAALIGRSFETDGAVSQFWRSLYESDVMASEPVMVPLAEHLRILRRERDLLQAALAEMAPEQGQSNAADVQPKRKTLTSGERAERFARWLAGDARHRAVNGDMQ